MSDGKNDQSETQNAGLSSNAGLGSNVTPLLTTAIRRARLEEAEHSDVITDLHAAELARLDMLRDALRPLLNQVPDHIDLFDVGIMPSEHPRLFIDMIGYVEMARDRRSYRFVQDTRHGRITIAESELIDPMCEAIAGYMARRLIERERALASDQTIEDAARRLTHSSEAKAPPSPQAPTEALSTAAPIARKRHWSLSLLGFVISAFGTLMVLSLLALGAWVAWSIFLPVLLNFISPTNF